MQAIISVWVHQPASFDYFSKTVTKVMLTLFHLCFWEMCHCFFIWTGPLWTSSHLTLSVRRDVQSAGLLVQPLVLMLCHSAWVGRGKGGEGRRGQEHLILCHWAGGEIFRSASEERREVYVTIGCYILIKKNNRCLMCAIYETNID